MSAGEKKTATLSFDLTPDNSNFVFFGRTPITRWPFAILIKSRSSPIFLKTMPLSSNPSGSHMLKFLVLHP
jgi:hypothetical protein